MTRVRANGRSPTAALLVGLMITLATVVAYSWYISGQISGLRRLQTELTDRNRRDSLQLLRIQNDLNQLALAMRDMLDAGEPYPLTAWSDAVRPHPPRSGRRAEAAGGGGRCAAGRPSRRSTWPPRWRSSGTPRIASSSWRAPGRRREARAQIRLSLQARQAALSTAVARLLVQNNASEEQTAQQVQDIYANVQRQVYWFLAATLAAIAATSLYLIRSNRRLFAQLAALSDRRRELAQKLIATRESTLREISRELHDEFGQILTAMGSMLGRAGKQAPEGSAAARRPARDRRDRADGARQRARPVADAPPVDPRGARAREHDRLVSVDGRETAGPRGRVRASRHGRRGRRHDRHPRLPRAAGGAEQRGAARRDDARLRCGCASTPAALELEVEDHGKGLDPDTRAARARPGGDARARRAGRRHARVPAAARRRHAGAPQGADRSRPATSA